MGQTKTREALKDHMESLPEFRLVKPVPLELFIQYLISKAPLQLSSDGIEVTRVQRCAIDLYIKSGCQDSTSGLPEIKDGKILPRKDGGHYPPKPQSAETCAGLQRQWPLIKYHDVFMASGVLTIRKDSKPYKKQYKKQKAVFAQQYVPPETSLSRTAEYFKSNTYIKRLLSDMIFDPGFYKRREVYEMAMVLRRYEDSWPWAALLQKYQECGVEYPSSKNNYRSRLEYGTLPVKKPPSPFLRRILTEFGDVAPPISIEHGISMLHDPDVVMIAVRDRLLDELSDVKYATLEKWRVYLVDRCTSYGKETNSLYSKEHERLRRAIQPVQIAINKEQRANAIKRELQNRKNKDDELERLLNEAFEWT